MHKENASVLSLTHIETGVVRTLLYFDIFKYPLTLEEIIEFHPEPNAKKDIEYAIASLKKSETIFNIQNFYSLHPNHDHIEKRKAGNALAKKKLKTAQYFARLISRFPYVRAVMLSGSISKNYMEANSDIDYFLITEPGRLWLTRGFLALFKRIFLFNSHKYFCANYLIDSNSLEIEEKNFYTAIEIQTLIPVYGRNIYNKFMVKNDWTRGHLPNNMPSHDTPVNDGKSQIKDWLEMIFFGRLGQWIDELCFKLAVRRWKKKYSTKFHPDEFQIAFKSKPNVSKNHPRFFQKKILDGYTQRIKEFESVNNLKLSA